MRRLRWGLLAAALLLLAGCGSGEGTDDAAPEPDIASIRTPTLAATSQAITAGRPAELTTTVLVTSPEGVSSPGLDAAVSVLVERPDVTVIVVAPAGSGAAPSGSHEAETRDGQTTSGFPAQILDAPVGGAVTAAVTVLGVQPDLVVVGFVEGAALGAGIGTSAVAGALDAAAGLGIPALAITAGTQHGADLAAAGLMLRSMLDVDLDTLLSPGARILAIPSCDRGLVRGPVATVASVEDAGASTVDCSSVASEPTDDVDAHSQGFATLVELGR